MTGPELIYLDYQATTPCDPRVVAEMMPWFAHSFANPTALTTRQAAPRMRRWNRPGRGRGPARR